MNDPRALERQGARLIGGSVLVLMLVAGAVAWRQMNTPALDPITLKAAGRPVCGQVSVLLDVTDPLKPGQIAAVTEWLREFEFTALRPNQQVTVWVLGTMESGGLARAFSRCYPGRETDRLLHNPTLSASRCESLFTEPLREAVAKAATNQRFPRSPILEAIRAIASQPEFAAATGGRHVVVVSDLLQHTPSLSFYRAVPDFDALLSTSRFRALLPNLGGVEVEVLRIPRAGESLEAELPLLSFWEAYLKAAGAQAVRIGRLG